MQIIAGQNVSPNNMPGPTGFGFGSGHNPNAAAVTMNNSGVAPTTSKTRPTLTQVDLRYWLMADCGLTVTLSGRPRAPVRRRDRVEIVATDHLRTRYTMMAATTMMKRAMKVADPMC